MQTLLQLLHFSLAFVVAWAAGMLGAAEEGPIPLLTIPVAVLTVLTVDRRRLWSVPVQVANVLGVIAFLITAVEFFRGDLERRVITGGHILTYLTCIFLVQPKGSIQIWLLLAMSVLQVAVASILTSNAWLGPTLLIYVLTVLWTLSVFSLYRAGLRVTERSSGLTGGVWTPAGTGSRFRHGVRAEQSNWVNSRFVFGGVTTTFLSVALAVVFFLFIPRMWITGLTIRAEDAQPLTGFAETVSLGDVGEILESADLVFDVAFHGFMEEEAMTPDQVTALVGPELIFRGAVLEQYRDGRWTLGRSRELLRQRAVAPRDRGSLIAQVINLQPIGTKVLFSVGFPVGAYDESQTTEIHLDRRSYELHRRIVSAGDPLTYRVFSRIEDLPQTPLLPDGEERRLNYLKSLTRVPISLDRLQAFTADLVGPDNTRLLQEFSNRRLRMDRGDFLDGITEAVAGPVGVGMQQDAAKRIETHLSGSGGYSYTLKQVVQDPAIDPLVDFLFNRKSGHCEYYASAMTMMLRCVGIPSRMISGFKGGQYNARNGRFEIRQLHAHTWVEAFIGNRWVTFDPTPGLRDLDVRERVDAHSSSRLGNLLENSKTLWGQSMHMTKDQQQEYLYRPVQDRLKFTWNITTGLLSGKLSLSDVVQTSLPRSRRWFSWQGGIVTGLLGLLVVGIARGGRSWLRRLRGRRAGVGADVRARMTVEFYERLMQIFANVGHRPQTTQTPREFVDATMLRLEPKLARHEVSLPKTRELIEWFYEVRFGGHSLPAERLAEIESRLTALESSFAKPETSPAAARR